MWGDVEGRTVCTPEQLAQELTLPEVEAYILANEWRVAKSMPTMPHAYNLKKCSTDPTVFERLVLFIRKYGYQKCYGRRVYTYFDVGPYCYWTMGAPVGETILINRAVKV